MRRSPRLAGDPYDEMDADGDGGGVGDVEDDGDGGEIAGELHEKL